MTRTGWIALSVALALALAAAAGVATWSAKRGAPAAAVQTPAGVLSIRALELSSSDVDRVQTTDLQRVLNITGNLNATQQALIKAKASGDLIAVLVKEGEHVKRGQLLARIDPADYTARVAAARANVEQAKANLTIGERTWTNNKALVEKGFISTNAMDTTENQAAALRAQLAAAQAQLAREHKALQDTWVRAPISGVVTERFAQAGEKVSPDARLMTLVDPSSLEFEAAVPAAEAALLRPGQALTVAPDGGEAFAAQVLRINAAVTAANRTVNIFTNVPAQAKARSGQFASASLRLADKPQAVVVPGSAVREVNGKTVVYSIVKQDGAQVIRAAPVQVGMRGENARGEPVLEVAGIGVGTPIIVRNLGPLREGAPVNIGTAAPVSAAAPAAK